MAEPFDRNRTVIGRHIRNVFAEGELTQECNVQNLHIANSDKPVGFYSLDVIISVGYRATGAAGKSDCCKLCAALAKCSVT